MRYLNQAIRYCLVFCAFAPWVAGALYLVTDLFYWLEHGEMMRYNLCLELGVLCSTDKFIGLDKILFSLTTNPFLALMMLGLVFKVFFGYLEETICGYIE